MRGAIFYIKAGKGHQVPAEALAQGFRDLGHSVFAFNFFDLMDVSFWQWFCRESWRFFLRFPILEQRYEAKIEGRTLEKDFLNFMRFTCRKKFLNWYREYRPDFLLSTNFVPLWVIPGLLKDLSLPLPHFAYNTDVFSVLSINLSPRVDRIFTVTEQSAEMMVAKGQPRDSISLCPFPLRGIFLNPALSKKEARESLGLQDRFTLLYNLGGEGIGDTKLVEELARRALKLQLVVTGGSDQATSQTLQKIKRRYPSFRLQIPGFVEKMDLYLYAADLVCGKAGANSVAEAMYAKRPFLITTGYYNVEATAEFLERYGVGWFKREVKEQADLIEKTMDDPNLLGEISFENLPIRFGARDLAQEVLNHLT